MAIEREAPRQETVMDVTQERIARVYAGAFIDVAAKSPNAAELIEELNALVSDVLNRVPQLEDTFRSALVSQEEKERLLDRVFANRLSPTVVNFLKVLLRHGRLVLLRSVARIVKKLHAERSGLAEVEVRVATALNQTLRDEIQEQLKRLLNKQPVMQVSVDPSLIAGIWVRVGDRVYDGSIRTQLEHARRHMIDLATERIETHPERFMRAGA